VSVSALRPAAPDSVGRRRDERTEKIAGHFGRAFVKAGECMFELAEQGCALALGDRAACAADALKLISKTLENARCGRRHHVRVHESIVHADADDLSRIVDALRVDEQPAGPCGNEVVEVVHYRTSEHERMTGRRPHDLPEAVDADRPRIARA
jgi:hypothetical protein